MLTRRQFIEDTVRASAGATVVLLLTPLGCGGGDDDVAAPTPTTNPTTPPACDGAGATSSNVNAHTHEVCVPLADLTSPPAGGNTYTTTVEDGHIHTISLDAGQLGAINAGQTVGIRTSLDDNHVHDFTLVR
jgi:hypothetical protein